MFKKWLQRYRGRPPTRGRIIDDLGRSFALFVDPLALRASIASRLRELFGCDSVVFCGFSAPEAGFVPDDERTGRTGSSRAFPAGGSLVKWLEVNQEPLLVPHPGGAFAYLDKQEQQLLLALGTRVCVPALLGAKPIALLLIVAKDPTWHLSPNDTDLLVRIGRQAALAIENTELQHLERERLKNLARAGQLAVAGQLAATIAHEIRNPLTAIRSTVQYVVDSSCDWPTKQELMRELLGEVDRIERTVSGVLALSRPQEAELTDIDLLEVVTQSFLLIQAYAHAHSITLTREFVVDALPIIGDRRSLHQVCLNLMLNACQAMPDGGRLTLRCALSEEPQPMAVLQVRDTGCGIPAEHISHVFDPFFTTKGAGTGLGLSICLDVVTKHGGQLRIDSRPGVGTSATVLLPTR